MQSLVITTTNGYYKWLQNLAEVWTFNSKSATKKVNYFNVIFLL